MHIVHNLLFFEEYHKIFRDKKHSFLLHGLRNPDATILCYTHFTTNNTHISTIQVISLSQRIRILLGNRDFWQMRGKDLSFRISLLHQLIQTLTLLRLYHMATYRFRHLNKLFQRILILDTLHIYGRHIELNVQTQAWRDRCPRHSNC